MGHLPNPNRIGQLAEVVCHSTRREACNQRSKVEQALTMAAWVAYEMRQKKSRRSQILASEAKALAEEIGLTL